MNIIDCLSPDAESRFTRKRPQVQVLYRPPRNILFLSPQALYDDYFPHHPSMFKAGINICPGFGKGVAASISDV